MDRNMITLLSPSPKREQPSFFLVDQFIIVLMDKRGAADPANPPTGSFGV